MIISKNLIKIKTSNDTFIQNALNHNLAQKNLSNSFYEYTKGLLLFGELIRANENQISIFQLNLYKDCFPREPEIIQVKYYAIDKTGLSIGFVFGPVPKETKNGYDPKFGSVNFDFFGCTSKIKNNYVYECCDNFPFSNGYSSLPNLDELKKHTPLLTDLPHTKFLISSEYWDLENNRKIIYRDDSRSFYLPLLELISSTINIQENRIKIFPKIEDEFISFKCYHTKSHGRKHECIHTWSGKISFDKFEIIHIEDEGEVVKRDGWY